MRINNRLLASGVLFFSMLLISSSARAEEQACQVCSKAGRDDVSYGTKAGTTLTRGAANTLFGWTELIRQPANEVKSGGNLFSGIAKGLGESLKRTGGGVGEILTFWTPKMNRHYLAFSKDCPVCMKHKTQEASKTQ